MLTSLDYVKGVPSAPSTRPYPLLNGCFPVTPPTAHAGIVAEYFHHHGKDYQANGNLFSNYPFLFHRTSKTAQTIVQKFQEVMSQYGPPSILILITTSNSSTIKPKSKKRKKGDVTLLAHTHSNIFLTHGFWHTDSA